MVTRIWQGKKELATKPYFCGQVWNVERKLWDTVTQSHDSEELARSSLHEYTNFRG
jgi:hypothetical protein